MGLLLYEGVNLCKNTLKVLPSLSVIIGCERKSNRSERKKLHKSKQA